MSYGLALDMRHRAGWDDRADRHVSGGQGDEVNVSVPLKALRISTHTLQQAHERFQPGERERV